MSWVSCESDLNFGLGLQMSMVHQSNKCYVKQQVNEEIYGEEIKKILFLVISIYQLVMGVRDSKICGSLTMIALTSSTSCTNISRGTASYVITFVMPSAHPTLDDLPSS